VTGRSGPLGLKQTKFGESESFQHRPQRERERPATVFGLARLDAGHAVLRAVVNDDAAAGEAVPVPVDAIPVGELGDEALRDSRQTVQV
jgi:hypothetical protein